MRKIGVIALVLAVSAVAANAAIYTTVAQGALGMTLRIDAVAGTATLYNNTGVAVASDGYEIWSTGSHLKISGTAGTGWVSLADQSYGSGSPNHSGLTTLTTPTRQQNSDAMHAALDRDLDYTVSGWGDANSNQTKLLSESTLVKADPANDVMFGGEAVFRPGVAAGWSIGKPVAIWGTDAQILADLRSTINGVTYDKGFFYIRPDSPGNKFMGNIEIVPEPATLAFLGIGGVVMAIRRRR
jgi:hypothetical protein